MKILKVLEKIGLVLLMFVFVFMVSYSAMPIKPVYGFALAWPVILALYALVASAGVYCYNYEDINAVANDLWSRSSQYIKDKFNAAFNSETNEINVDEELANHVNSYVDNNYNPSTTSQQLSNYFVSAAFSPGIMYQYIPYTGTLSGGQAVVTSALYNDARCYDSIVFANNTLSYQYTASYWYLFSNGVCSLNLANNGVVYTNLKYWSTAFSQDMYYRYNSRRYNDDATTNHKPKFAFLCNAITGVNYNVVIYYDGYSSYYAQIYTCNLSGSVLGVSPSITAETVNVEAVVNTEVSLSAGIINIQATLQEILDAINTQTTTATAMDTYFEQYGYLPISLSGDLDIPVGENDFRLPDLPIIATKFPFCIPFDLAYAFSTMIAEPEVPVIDVNLQDTPLIGGSLMTLDFAMFQPIADIIRWAVLIIFNIGLILVTRKIIRG